MFHNLRTLANSYLTTWIHPPPSNDSPCNILVVFGHPNCVDSFSSEISRRAVQGLLRNGNIVKIVNVSDGTSNPLLQSEELNKRHSHLVQSEWLKSQVDLLTWCDKILWIYPTWWSSVPAGIKGWIDRVFTEGFAYASPGTVSGEIKPLLKIKKTGIITTWGGSRLAPMYTGDLGKRLLCRCIPSACYITRPTPTLYLKLHKVDESSSRRQEFLDEVERRLSEF